MCQLAAVKDEEEEVEMEEELTCSRCRPVIICPDRVDPMVPGVMGGPDVYDPVLNDHCYPRRLGMHVVDLTLRPPPDWSALRQLQPQPSQQQQQQTKKSTLKRVKEVLFIIHIPYPYPHTVLSSPTQ